MGYARRGDPAQAPLWALFASTLDAPPAATGDREGVAANPAGCELRGPIRLSGLLIVLTILVAGTACSPVAERDRKDAAVAPNVRVEAPSTKVAEVPAELQRELEAVAASSRGDVGIAVRDLSGRYGDGVVGVGEDEVFPSASLIKVLILAELLRQVDGGKVSLEEPLGWSTVGARANSMIAVSDNDATDQLVDRVGFEPVNALATELGLEETHLGAKMRDAGAGENRTSARDMTTLLAAIWEGELLSPSSTRFALSTLEGQRLDAKIPAALPPGTRVLHKTGELEGYEHDAAIVAVPDHEFAVAVLTRGDSAAGVATIRRASGATYGVLVADGGGG